MATALGGRPPAQIMRTTERKLATESCAIEEIDRGPDTRDRGNELAEHTMFHRNPKARQTLL
jgi:hypothetical protein